MDATGKKVGEAILEQRDDSVQIRATFIGLPPGEHAFHIRETGKCDPPFESAGGHFNPTGKQPSLERGRTVALRVNTVLELCQRSPASAR